MVADQSSMLDETDQIWKDGPGQVDDLPTIAIGLVDSAIFKPLIPYSCTIHISNNSSFRQKHPAVPDGSDGSDGTSYPLTENYTLPIAQATDPSILDWCSAGSPWEHLESQ